MPWFFVSRYNLKDDPILTDEPYAQEKNQPAIHAGHPFELDFISKPENAKSEKITDQLIRGNAVPSLTKADTLWRCRNFEAT